MRSWYLPITTVSIAACSDKKKDKPIVNTAFHADGTLPPYKRLQNQQVKLLYTMQYYEDKIAIIDSYSYMWF